MTAQLLHCTQTCDPACPWTGTSEAMLIGHYLAVHHQPSAHAYILVSDSLRQAQHNLEHSEKLVAQARVGFQAVLLNTDEDSPIHRATRHYLWLMEGRVSA